MKVAEAAARLAAVDRSGLAVDHREARSPKARGRGEIESKAASVFLETCSQAE